MWRAVLDTADYCTLQPCRARLRMRNENIIQKFLSPFIKIHSNNIYIYIHFTIINELNLECCSALTSAIHLTPFSILEKVSFQDET